MTNHSLVPAAKSLVDQPSEEPRLIGYARVSTDDQDLSLQIDALTKQGVPTTSIFMDQGPGVSISRPPNDVRALWDVTHVGSRSFASKAPQNKGEGAFEAKERC